MSSRLFVLGLYRRLLRLHQKLPSDLETLGRVYIQSEFKRHRQLRDEKLIKEFVAEWEVFEGILRKQVSSVESAKLGRNLEETVKGRLSEQQWGQLTELYNETKKFK